MNVPPRAPTRVQQKAIEEAEMAQNLPASNLAGGSPEKSDDRVWVACNRCDKWRALPSTVDAKSLPDVWLCEYNTFDLQRNTCDVPEETYVQPDAKLKVRN
jgi:hypothetical protein